MMTMRWSALLGLWFGACTLWGQTPCENGFAAGYPCDQVDLMGFVPSSSMGAVSYTHLTLPTILLV